jgi:hypothetical protein
MVVTGGAQTVEFAAGSAAAPSITFTGDTNTGIFSPAADTLAFTEGGAESMRINSAGDILINTTSVIGGVSKQSLAFNGSANWAFGINDTSSTNASSFIMFQTGGVNRGNITNSGNTGVSYNTTSDYRLKENIAPMTGALATVSALKPVTYKWKSDGSDGQGFIAHELQSVVPDCVNGQKDAVDAEGNPQYQGIDTSFLVATLTAAIQELNAKVDAQALEIKALKGAA